MVAVAPVLWIWLVPGPRRKSSPISGSVPYDGVYVEGAIGYCWIAPPGPTPIG